MIRPSFHVSIALMAIVNVSCSSAPPKPPQVDESGRRPANSKSALELQSCRGALLGARADLVDAQRVAQDASRVLAEVTTEELRCGVQPAAATNPTVPSPHPLAGNVVWSLHFGFDSSRIDASSDELARLAEAARSAAFVVIKGRTDGSFETAGESAVARRRMEAMYEVLLKGGVDPRRVALQYQPVGDRIADNETEEGRAANRRVDVELYPVAPLRFEVHEGAALIPSAALAAVQM